MKTKNEIANEISEVLINIWTDEDYKQKFITDPHPTLREIGFPDEYVFTVCDYTDNPTVDTTNMLKNGVVDNHPKYKNQAYFNIPPKPNGIRGLVAEGDEDLSDEQLETVQGGEPVVITLAAVATIVASGIYIGTEIYKWCKSGDEAQVDYSEGGIEYIYLPKRKVNPFDKNDPRCDPIK